MEPPLRLYFRPSDSFILPKIVFKCRVRATKRQLICSTDEAVVTRLRCSGPRYVRDVGGGWVMDLSAPDFSSYDGMVERLQRYPGPGSKNSMEFIFVGGDDAQYSFSSSSHMYHVLKFKALAMARTVFPKNFLRAHELRFFSQRNVWFAATYSDFVPDTTGVCARQSALRERFNREPDMGEKLAIRTESDRREHELVPQLAPFVETVAAAGIIIPHPEANYQITEDGEILFFEICGIDLQKALAEARRRFAVDSDIDFLYALADMHAAIILFETSIRHKTVAASLKSGSSNDNYVLGVYAAHLELPFNVLRERILLRYLLGKEDCMNQKDFLSLLPMAFPLEDARDSFDCGAVATRG